MTQLYRGPDNWGQMRGDEPDNTHVFLRIGSLLPLFVVRILYSLTSRARLLEAIATQLEVRHGAK